jgi:hypothetical protein
MANPLSTLEQDLEALATPQNDPTVGGLTGTPTGVLTAIQALLTALEEIQDIGPAITTLVTDLGTVIGQAADAIDTIATQLSNIEAAAGGTIGDVASVMGALQNGLSTAQTLIPGAANASALQSGSQFFGMLQQLLSDPAITTIAQANTYLFQIAEQLRTIAQNL